MRVTKLEFIYFILLPLSIESRERLGAYTEQAQSCLASMGMR